MMYDVLNVVCGAFRDLVPFLQFKKREKHPWRSVVFSKVAVFSRGCFSCFLNCAHGTKSRNAPHMYLQFRLSAES